MAEETKAEKAAREVSEKEAARRAALTPEQRGLEDRALANGLTVEEQEEKERLEDQERLDNDAARTGNSGGGSIQANGARRAELDRKAARNAAIKREDEATVEARVARGRTVFTAHDQAEPHRPGAIIKLTPAEYTKLVALGTVEDPEGSIQEPDGPAVYRESGLLQGHALNQGQTQSK